MRKGYRVDHYGDSVFYDWTGSSGFHSTKNPIEIAVETFQFNQSIGKSCNSIKVMTENREYKFFIKWGWLVDFETGKKLSKLEKKSLSEKQ